MFEYLCGIVADINLNEAIIDVNDMGYELTCTSSLINELKIGNKVKVYTYLAVREDGINLYGFNSKAEKNIFLRLISVNGIGAKVAIGILSEIGADDLAMCIVNGDIRRLNQIKGIGKKTAERIVLELKDKVTAEFKSVEVKSDNNIPMTGIVEDAVLALISLGFNKNEALKALEGADPNLSLEETVKYALKKRR